MAPEQARGESQIDARADIWALGVGLYETVSGACPFTGANYQALLWAILMSEPQPLSQHGIDEPELWAIIARCLSKSREDRFHDMRALGGALAGYLASRGVHEDITKSPLGAWLTPRVAGGEPLLSLFPSSATPDTVRSLTHSNGQAPPAPPPLELVRVTPAQDAALLQATRAIGPREGLFGPVSSEPRPAELAAAARARTTETRLRPAALFHGSRKLWLGIAALGVVTAFALAAWRAPSAPSEEPEPSPRSEAKALAEAPAPPVATSVPAVERSASVPAATAALVARAPRVEPQSQPKAPRPSARAPREKKAARPAELKNPFADGR
jgi:serine/threonine-protein kinase